LRGWFLYVKDVIDKLPDLDNILKYELEYKKIWSIHISPNYWHHFRKDLFAMIRQLGPSTIFVIFTSAKSK
jgi:hypothetical protein